MINEYGVLKPDVPRPGGPAQEAHEHWRQERKEKYPDWKLLSPEYNVRFVHDVRWRGKLFSIQCAHDAVGDNFDASKSAHWVWKTIFLLMLVADLMWYVRVNTR